MTVAISRCEADLRPMVTTYSESAFPTKRDSGYSNIGTTAFFIVDSRNGDE